MVSFQHAFYIISKFALQRGVIVSQFDASVHAIDNLKKKPSCGDIILMVQPNVVVGVCHVKHISYNHLSLDIATHNKGYEKILSAYVMLKTAMKLRAYWKDDKDFIMYVTILLSHKINIEFTSFEEVTSLIKEDLHLLLKPTPYNVCHKGKVTACNAHGGKYEPKNKNCKTGMNKSYNSVAYNRHDIYDENVVKTQRELEKEHVNQTEIEKQEKIEKQKQKKEERKKQIQARHLEKEEEKKKQKCEKCIPCSQDANYKSSGTITDLDAISIDAIKDDRSRSDFKMIQNNFNVIPNNIINNGVYEFNLPSFNTTLKFYIFAKNVKYVVNNSHILCMSSNFNSMCRFEIYFKKDIKNKICIDNDKMKNSRTDTVQYEYSNTFNSPFVSDIITIVVSDSDYTSRFAYVEIDHTDIDTRLQCP